MDLFWSEELATHHREIDTHHRFIVKAINRMRVANSSRPRDLCGLLTIMTSLANLLALHFRYEEVLLEQCGYPDRGETAVDHGYILGQIESMRHALSCQQEVSFRQRLKIYSSGPTFRCGDGSSLLESVRLHREWDWGDGVGRRG